MKITFLKITSITTFVLFGSFFLLHGTLADAALFKGFGIQVTALKAQPIEEKEKQGYICVVPGQTVEGRLVGSPKGTPTSYLIPASLAAKGGGKPTVGKQMFGAYTTIKTPIVCIRPPYDVTVVMLDTVGQQWGIPKGKF